MTTIEITVSKSQVYAEVDKTASYVGHKMVSEDDAYNRIMTVDEDRQMLERFWVESADAATSALRHHLVYADEQQHHHGADMTQDYDILLEMPLNFNDALVPNMKNDLFSYFVNSILAKWFIIANKDEAAAYATTASGLLENIVQMTYQRRRPKRVTPPETVTEVTNVIPNAPGQITEIKT